MSSRNRFVSLRYPNQPIGSDYDYMVFNVKKYTPSQNGLLSGGFFGFNVPQTSGATTNTEGQIILPMPDGLTDSNSVNWTSDNLNSIDATIFKTLSGAVEGMNIERARTELEAKGKKTDFFDTIGQMLSNTGASLGQDLKEAGSALSDDRVKNALKTRFTADAANIFGANIDPNRLISRATGQVLNPNMELLFEGVNLRTFNFSFSLTPRDRSESLQIKAIIRTFKRRMAAKNETQGAGGGIFISAPDIFEVEFRSGGGEHPFLFQMKPMALKSMNVSYMDGTPYMTYDDATPVKMRLNLQMQELVPIYSSDYEDDIPAPDEGVGF